MGDPKDGPAPAQTAQTPPIALTEDEIDDLLYIARANELSELSPYLHALSHTHSAPAAAILSSAVDPTSRNSALHYAAANGHLAVVRALLAAFDGAEPQRAAFANAQNDAGSAPLHWAAVNGRLDVVKALVAAGARPALLNAAGHDAVFEAERAGRQDVVEWLLKEGEGLETGVGGGREEEGEVEDDGNGESSAMAEGDDGLGRAAGDGVEMDVDVR